jgi:hypothetical protein
VKVLAQLRNPQLEAATLVSFRYNDFDLTTGQIDRPSSNALVELILRASLHGARIQIVTRDPFSQADEFLGTRAFKSWYLGLERLARANVEIRIHPTLHSKLYLFSLKNAVRFYAIGSSNLTAQGMGYGWLECNAFGYHGADFGVLRDAAGKILGDRRIETFDFWERRLRKNLAYARLVGPRA